MIDFTMILYMDQWFHDDQLYMINDSMMTLLRDQWFYDVAHLYWELLHITLGMMIGSTMTSTTDMSDSTMTFRKHMYTNDDDAIDRRWLTRDQWFHCWIHYYEWFDSGITLHDTWIVPMMNISLLEHISVTKVKVIYSRNRTLLGSWCKKGSRRNSNTMLA